jgi:SpoU rRNA methylase family enzyme
VNTCIIYIKNTFEKGGELFITDNGHDMIEVIRPEPGRIVLMSGHQSHGITPVIGLGVRECVVFQVRARAEAQDEIDESEQVRARAEAQDEIDESEL